MKNARSGWNAAKLASERPLPKARKMHGPGGSDYVNEVSQGVDRACRSCGHLTCSCTSAPDRQCTEDGFISCTLGQPPCDTCKARERELSTGPFGGLSCLARGCKGVHHVPSCIEAFLNGNGSRELFFQTRKREDAETAGGG